MIKKHLFVERATTTGGRRGVAKTPDGRIELKLDSPPQLGGAGRGSNPEQLLACAYSACFGGTIEFLARQEGLQVAESQVTADVTFGLSDRGGYELGIALGVYLPGVPPEVTERLIAAAHDLCPVSRAIHGNVEVATHIVNEQSA